MLQVDIQTNGFELTPAIEDQIEKATHKISQVDDRVAKLTAFLDIQKRKDDNGCRVKYKIDKPGKNIIIEDSGDNLYEVLDRLSKAAVREVRKEKEKDLGR